MQQEPTKNTKNNQPTIAPADNNKDNKTDNTMPVATIAKKPHRAPFWGDVLAVLTLFFLAQFAGAAICNLIGLSPYDATAEGVLQQVDFEESLAELKSRYVACSFFFAMTLCFTALTIYRKWRGWNKIITFRAPGWASPFRLLCAYILMWCFSIATEPFATLLGEAPEQILQGGWLLLSAVIVAPIFEETIFRGYIAGTLRKAYGSIAAWIVSSILFGLAHGAPSTALTASFSGLILCYCYMRYRSLVLAIILHAMNNATACFMLSIGLGDATTREVIANDQVYWAVYALCLSITIIAIARMWQEIKSLESNKYLH